MIDRKLPSFWEGFGRFLAEDADHSQLLDAHSSLEERSPSLREGKMTEDSTEGFEESEGSCESGD